MVDIAKIPKSLNGTILVAGAGVSGLGISKLLAELGLDVVVADDNETARLRLIEVVDIAELSTAQARAELGRFSIVVTSPGWQPNSPLLVDAQNAGLEVIGDVELAWRLDQAGVFGSPRTWLAVTGTNGKTTTTAMLASMMTAGGASAQAVGNIGIPVSEALTSVDRIDVIVAELSSFQLHWAPTFVPDAGVLLNIAEDHIDWHGTFEAYALAKMKVLNGPVAVIGADDDYLVELTKETGKSQLTSFTQYAPATQQLGVVDGYLVDNAFSQGESIAPVNGINPAGPAGILDALAAAAIARSQGISATAIAQALADFQVSGHRGQVIATINGVEFIDNSKATNPHAADAALRAKDSVVWIVGGQLKGADIAELIKTHADRIKAALVLGIDRAQIVAALAQYAPAASVFVTDSNDPEAAMSELVAQAFDIVAPGDCVLLAPAAASLDMYKGMGQRGDLFAQAVLAKQEV